MAGTAPIDSFFPPQTRSTRQSTKRKGLELLNDDERDWTPSKRVKTGKGKAVAQPRPAPAKQKATHASKQAKLAFGLQTPASSVATPQPSSSRARKQIALDEPDTPQPAPTTSAYDTDVVLPTPQATARKGKATRAFHRPTEDASEPSSGTRAASPIIISSSSLDHISPPPAARVKRAVRPLRTSGSIIELTSSEDEDVHSNPFVDRTVRSHSPGSDYELPHLSGPLSPLTQQSSIESGPGSVPEFKVPELPSHMRDAPRLHLRSQVVPSSQSQEMFGSSSSRRSATSPITATSPLLDTTDMRRALPSSGPEIVSSSQTQELPSFFATSSPPQPFSSSLPPSSAPEYSSQSATPLTQLQDVQPMILGPLLNDPLSSRLAQDSPRSTLHKSNHSSHSQVESSQLEELELLLPPSPSRSSRAAAPTKANSPSRQRRSPTPASTPSNLQTYILSKRISAPGESAERASPPPSQVPASSHKAHIVPSDAPIDSATREEALTPAREHRIFTDSPTQEETPIKSPTRAIRPVVDESPTQEELTQSTPYKRRRPRADLGATKRPSPLKPRAQSIVAESDSDTELRGPLPALRLGASQSDSEADDEVNANRAGPSSRAALARIGNGASFLYTGSGKRSRDFSQRSKQASEGRPNDHAARLAQQDMDSQDAFFNPVLSQGAESSSDFGSFVGSIDSDIAEYIAMDIDPPSFSLHTQDLLPVKSVLDRRPRD
ncbi:unnamed protein product [Peniophora sp. CBMAI 1063]|nr:unnamed protein product [Peniophora sp. CBMAI 1063]